METGATKYSFYNEFHPAGAVSEESCRLRYISDAVMADSYRSVYPERGAYLLLDWSRAAMVASSSQRLLSLWLA